LGGAEGGDEEEGEEMTHGFLGWRVVDWWLVIDDC
jgi:hypothetical protein